jgi:hypothetical protein
VIIFRDEWCILERKKCVDFSSTNANSSNITCDLSKPNPKNWSNWALYVQPRFRLRWALAPNNVSHVFCISVCMLSLQQLLCHDYYLSSLCFLFCPKRGKKKVVPKDVSKLVVQISLLALAYITMSPIVQHYGNDREKYMTTKQEPWHCNI